MPRFFVDIEARFSQVQDALNQITKNTEKATKQMSSAFAGVKSALATLGVGAGVGVFGRELIRATTEAEQGAARLEAVLRATGGTVGIARRELDELAESMKGALGVDDDQVRKAQTTLLRFGNIQGDVFREALKLSADLSAALGVDIADAAHQLGRAVQSPTEGLRALEQQFGKLDPATEKFINNLARQGKTVEAQREVLRLYDQKIAGTAQLMNTGFTKATRDVSVAWDDLLKSLGKTDGAMAIVREAFGGLAVVLKTIRGLMEEPAQEAALAPLAESVKLANKEIDKLIARQTELNAKKVLNRAEATELATIEEKINQLIIFRNKYTKEYNDLNAQITRQRQKERDGAEAAKGEPTLGGSPKPISQEEQAFKRALESMRDQLDKLQHISLEEKTLRDIRAGAFGELDKSQQRNLLNLAREVDALKKVEAQQKLVEDARLLVNPPPPIEDFPEVLKFWQNYAKSVAAAEVELDKTRETLQRTTDLIVAPLPADMAWEQGLDKFWAQQATQITDFQRRIDEAATDLGFTFQSAFEDAIVEGEKFSDVLKAIEKDIARIILRMTVTRPLAEGIASWAGAAFGGLFGGGAEEPVQLSGPGRASGGPVTAGRPYIVGEEGPELFIPSRSGSIAPNDSLGGVTVNNGDIIISGGGVTMPEVRQALAASERRTIAAVRELNRR